MAATFYIAGVSSLSATAFAGGVSGVNGRGATTRVTFGGTWAVGDKYSMQLVTPSLTYQLGVGNLTGIIPTACITLNKRIHFISGSLWFGSDNSDPTGWETQAPGAFDVDVSESFIGSDTLVSLQAYQGKIALFSNNTVQIWFLAADPTQIAQSQVLGNIGTYSHLGPQSIGDLDVIFPSLTGFRSLRVRDSSNNAFVNDLGSPVDLNIQQDLAAVGFNALATTCSIVEPTANRYWHYINGHIYVLSYFPAAKIPAAWSKYTPEYFVNGVLTSFIPQKFVVYNQQVFCLGSVNGVNHVICFGYDTTGAVTYDATTAIAETPWVDLKTPGVRKYATSTDYAITGKWQIQGSMDYKGVTNGGALQNITNMEVGEPSFQLGEQPWSDDGFHIKLRAISTNAAYTVLSELVFHYRIEDEK